jgi:hypothetical protein
MTGHLSAVLQRCEDLLASCQNSAVVTHLYNDHGIRLVDQLSLVSFAALSGVQRGKAKNDSCSASNSSGYDMTHRTAGLNR